MMKCERFMDRYLGLDENERMSLPMRRHLKRCSRCRSEVSAVKAAMSDMRGYTDMAVVDVADVVMNRIGAPEYTYRRRVWLLNWIGVGVVILGSIFLLPFSGSLLLLKNYFGRQLEITFYMVMGAVITVYVAVFIATNIDRFMKPRGKYENSMSVE